ncbi:MULTISPECIES: GNAT family N-acetyltransferase [Cupriavidus]|uniref:GNAT family N-acetyltransferase n=1 Tax=Cupriavidus oxalaticus TaxID=96344 RepID=A0A4P7LBE8_9BURK|nr:MULTISPECIES: GNAT family N-acetyltransferase [Cupriavidus]MBF6992640.1 GNAT family N-acetyltransferase [Cupriavidus sp. IK-TO18]QBY53160.1 GNAT family N-acetyltransferase [Cupriavidus oxalaticus]TDF62577.1 GNAT family N-acetyltransferase [Cupriavidus sp. L7L]
MIRNARLRAANAEDLEAVGQVLAACGLPLPEPRDATPLYHVAIVEDSIVGCACGEQRSQTIVVHTVAVLPGYRGHRLATHLVSVLLTRARANGCTKATVLTNENPGFFARYGFSLTPTDTVVREMQLSMDFLRRFGARSHYMCRQL